MLRRRCLSLAARRFRQAIEKSDRTRLSIDFAEFPLGSCGTASLLLGTYLQRLGFGGFDYVLGRRGRGCDIISHAWLKDRRFLVDITADQFKESRQEVIVATQSTWHETFIQEVEHEAHLRVFDPQAQHSLRRDLTEICRNLSFIERKILESV